MESVTVYLTTQDAAMFKEWQQFHAMFALFAKSGVFDMRSGSVTIHFDPQGKVQRIERKDDLFNARNLTQ